MKFTYYCFVLVLGPCSFLAAASGDQDSNKHGSYIVDDPQFKIDDPNEFYQNYWREYSMRGYKVGVIDKNLDTRVANILYASTGVAYFSKDFHKFIFDDPDIRDEYEAYMDRPEVNQAQCTKHLMQMNELLDEIAQINRYHRSPGSNRPNTSVPELNEKHILLARVLDSYGRYESGVLIGASDLLGSYEQCMETQLKLGPPSGQQVVGTRYCKARFGLTDDLDPRIRKGSGVHLKVGICLPNTCHTSSFRHNKHLIQRLVDSQFSMPGSIYVKEHRQIDELFCINDNNSSLDLPLSGKLFIFAAIIWTILLINATFFGETGQSKAMEVICNCFNVKTAILDFFNYNRASRRAAGSQDSTVNFDALNIVRTSGVSGIVLGHTILVIIDYSPNVIQQATLTMEDHFRMGGFFVNLVVDTFFVFSSILFCYMSFKKMKTEIETAKTFGEITRLVGKLFANRYFRLVPLYFVMFWFKKSVLLYMGSGPTWDHGFNQETLYSACRQNTWLDPLSTLLANRSLGQQCILPTWSLDCDIFFIFVTTPLVIVFVKRPKLGIAISILITMVSIVLMYDALFSIDQTDLMSLNSFDSNFFHLTLVKYSNIYTNPTYRLVSVMCGMLSGYALYCYEEGSREWPRWFKMTTPISVGALIVAFLSYLLIPELSEYMAQSPGRNLFIHTMATYRVAWALASCAIALRLVTDCRDTQVARLFRGNSSFISSMAKLNLAVILVHYDVLTIKYIFGGVRWEGYTFFRWLDAVIVVYAYTIVTAWLVHIFVESPINKLIQTALRPAIRVEPQKKQS